jgi:polyphosphate kinase
MEQWVRVQNERDRQVLVWLRARFDDEVIIAAAQRCVSPGVYQILQRPRSAVHAT